MAIQKYQSFPHNSLINNYMHKKQTPFCVQTFAGKLQLTKGSYLTLLKRKSSLFKQVKTVKKQRKMLNKNYELLNQCSTKKKNIQKLKPIRRKKPMKHTVGSCEIALRDSKKNIVLFSVRDDKQYFVHSFGNIPTIKMQYDNDNETQWEQIGRNVQNLSLDLLLSAYDKMYCR